MGQLSPQHVTSYHEIFSSSFFYVDDSIEDADGCVVFIFVGYDHDPLVRYSSQESLTFILSSLQLVVSQE